jgi:hypothetical protein
MVGFEPPNRSQVAASPSHLGVSGIETCSHSARSFFHCTLSITRLSYFTENHVLLTTSM